MTTYDWTLIKNLSNILHKTWRDVADFGNYLDMTMFMATLGMTVCDKGKNYI